MSRLRELAEIAEAHGIGFQIESGDMVLSYTYNHFEPYKLQPVNIEDFYRKHLDNRPMKPVKPNQRVFPEDRGEYQDYLEEQMRDTWQALEERQQERHEARLEGIRECHRSAEEKWAPRDPKEVREEQAEYREKLLTAQRRLPGFRESEGYEKLRIQRK